jgi:hypothetical protein
MNIFHFVDVKHEFMHVRQEMYTCDFLFKFLVHYACCIYVR